MSFSPLALLSVTLPLLVVSVSAIHRTSTSSLDSDSQHVSMSSLSSSHSRLSSLHRSLTTQSLMDEIDDKYAAQLEAYKKYEEANKAAIAAKKPIPEINDADKEDIVFASDKEAKEVKEKVKKMVEGNRADKNEKALENDKLVELSSEFSSLSSEDVSSPALLSSSESVSVSGSDSVALEASTFVTVPGDVQSLTINGVAVALPLVAAPNTNPMVYRGRPGGALPCVLQVDTGHTYNGAWWAAWTGRANAALVFAANHQSAFNLPLGVTRITLEHRAHGAIAPFPTYIIEVYNDLTFGLELEDDVAVRCCAFDVHIGRCAQLQQTDVLARTIDVPGTGLPYLKIELEVNNIDGSLEYVTGPAPLGVAAGAVSAHAQDVEKALSLLVNTFTYQLSHPNGACGRFNTFVRAWVTFNQIIVAYNNAVPGAGFNTPNNWLLSLPNASPKVVNLNNGNRGFRYKWRVQCAYRYNAANTNMQVNVVLPLKSIGSRKNLAVTSAVPTHFIDWFPAAPFGYNSKHYVAEYVTRAQYVASRLVGIGGALANAGPLAGVAALVGAGITQLQLDEFQGFLAAWLMTLVHTTMKLCAIAHGEGVAHGQSKNLHVNMFKPCLNDIPRYFPNAITDLFVGWWSAAHMAGGNAAARKAALYAWIYALFTAPYAPNNAAGLAAQGRLRAGTCGALRIADPNGAHLPPIVDYTAAVHLRTRFIEAIEENSVQSTFIANAAWHPRYAGEAQVGGVGAGHQAINGVTNRANNPANQWGCFCGVNFDRTYPPLRDVRYGELGILVEARYDGMPLNVAFMPSGNPLAPANWGGAGDIVRTIANS